MKSTYFEEWIKCPSLIKVLIHLNNNKPSYATKICKEIHMTYRTGWVVLKYLSKIKLIYKIKDKKKKYIYLTDKGKEIATKLNELNNFFNVTIR